MNMGFLDNVNSIFPYGGIGFRTMGPEKFSVDDLYIDPLADSAK